MCMCVLCVCVCERERERVCVCVYHKANAAVNTLDARITEGVPINNTHTHSLYAYIQSCKRRVHAVYNTTRTSQASNTLRLSQARARICTSRTHCSARAHDDTGDLSTNPASAVTIKALSAPLSNPPLLSVCINRLSNSTADSPRRSEKPDTSDVSDVSGRSGLGHGVAADAEYTPDSASDADADDSSPPESSCSVAPSSPACICE